MGKLHLLLSINYGTVNPMSWTLWRYFDDEHRWRMEDYYIYDSRECGKVLTDSMYVDCIAKSLEDIYFSTLHFLDLNVVIEKGAYGFEETLQRKFQYNNYIELSITALDKSTTNCANNTFTESIEKNNINSFAVFPKELIHSRISKSLMLALYYMRNCSDKILANSDLTINNSEEHMDETKYEYTLFLDGREVAKIDDDQYITMLFAEALLDKFDQESNIMITIERNIVDNDCVAPTVN